MKLLYIHDSLRLSQDSNGQLYTDSNYTPAVWRRYTELANEVTAVFRKPNGHTVSEAALGSMEPMPEEQVRCVQIPDRNVSLKAFFSRHDRITVRRLMHELVEDNDSLIVRLPSYAGSIALAHARRIGRPVMVEVVGCAWDTLWNHSAAGKLLAPWSFVRMRRGATLATHAVYVTHAYLQRRYPCPGRTLACPDVVLQPTSELRVQSRNARLIALRGRRLVVGTAGAVNVRYKGHDLVIRALADLAKEGINYEYRIAGGGDQTRLRRLARVCGIGDRVMFLGALSHHDIMGFYDELDLYVQPSRSEGLPRALMEAMSRGCPAVGSSTGGIPELLDQEATFRSGSKADLVSVLREASSVSFLKRQSERNWNFAISLQEQDLEARRRRFVKEFLEERSSSGQTGYSTLPRGLETRHAELG